MALHETQDCEDCRGKGRVDVDNEQIGVVEMACPNCCGVGYFCADCGCPYCICEDDQ